MGRYFLKIAFLLSFVSFTPVTLGHFHPAKTVTHVESNSTTGSYSSALLLGSQVGEALLNFVGFVSAVDHLHKKGIRNRAALWNGIEIAAHGLHIASVFFPSLLVSDLVGGLSTSYFSLLAFNLLAVISNVSRFDDRRTDSRRCIPFLQALTAWDTLGHFYNLIYIHLPMSLGSASQAHSHTDEMEEGEL